ncbi:MAG: hypothetical protein AAFY56_18820, partial [Pseudomonadota bacterium]
ARNPQGNAIRKRNIHESLGHIAEIAAYSLFVDPIEANGVEPDSCPPGERCFAKATISSPGALYGPLALMLRIPLA